MRDMVPRLAWVFALAVVLPLALGAQTPRVAPPIGDVFSSKSCETPDRDAGCAPVRFGWGDCPDHRGACDWCYGQHGVFAYVRRVHKTYNLSSGCDDLGQQAPGDVFWVVADAGTRERMNAAGADCQSTGRLGLICQVDPSAFKNPGRGRSPQNPQERPPAAADPAAEAARQIATGWNQPGARLKAGVSYTSTGFSGQRLHAVRITGEAGFRVALSGPGGLRLGQAVAQGSIRNGKVGGEVGGGTGTFSNWSPNLSRDTRIAPGGPVIQGGRVTAPNRSLQGTTPKPRSLLGWTGQGFFVADVPAFQDAEAQRRFLEQNVIAQRGATEGLGGLGRLLASGDDVHRRVAMGPQGLNPQQAGDTPNARAVAGVSADGGTLFLLIEEGNGQAYPPKGATTEQMVRLLSALGARDAVLFDGGGSAEIAVPARGVESLGGGGRNLPTWILF
jgi:hypothetical protein